MHGNVTDTPESEEKKRVGKETQRDEGFEKLPHTQGKQKPMHLHNHEETQSPSQVGAV